MDVGEIKEPCLGACPNPPKERGNFRGICRINVMYMEYPASGRYAQPYLVGGRNDALLLSVLQQLFLLCIAVALLYLLGSMFALRACDTAYCYRYGVVCGRLCLLNTSVSPAKTAEVITVLWSMMD